MTAMAANQQPALSLIIDDAVAVYGAVGSDITYQGSLVGSSGGYAAPLTTSLSFLGVALEMADNAAGSSGDIRILVATEGVLRECTIAGASTVASIGAQVYAVDDNPAALTLTIGSNVCIGHIQNFNPVTGKFDVHFRGAQRRHIT